MGKVTGIENNYDSNTIRFWVDSNTLIELVWHDNKFRILHNGEFLRDLVPTTIADGQNVLPYDPASPFLQGNYVSYVNSSSTNPQFRFEGLYRVTQNAAAGENPENTPAKFVFQGIPTSAFPTLEVYNSTIAYIANNRTYVTYVNPTSTDPTFTTERLFRCITNASAGESPESTPAKWEAIGGGTTGTLTFLNLTDSPSAYTGAAGRVVAVNSAETGLEFIEFPANIITSIVNIGTGLGIYRQLVSGEAQFRSLIAGNFISLTSPTDEVIQINATPPVQTVGNSGSGTAILKSLVNNQLVAKSLIAGNAINITETNDEITISAQTTGETNTGINVGTGESIYISNLGTQLQFKTLVAGDNVDFSTTSNTIIINASGVGQNNTASNRGTGEGIFAAKISADLQFKSLIGGTGITLVANDNSITANVTLSLDDLTDTPANKTGQAGRVLAVNSAENGLEYVDNAAASGEINTAENSGTAGIGLFINKVGPLLRFKNINSAGTIAVIDNTADNELVLNVDPAQLNLNDLGEKDYNNLDNLPTIPTRVSDLVNDTLIMSLQQGDGINIDNTDPRNPIISATLESPGETNVGVNVGTTGVGVYRGKTDVSLEFRRFISSDNSVLIAVNSSNTAIDLTLPGDLGAQNFTELQDTPANYTGQTGRLVAVNTAEDALEFVDAPDGITNISIVHAASNVIVQSDTGTDGTIGAATQTFAGVMSAADKIRLDGIPANLAVTDANNNFTATQTVNGNLIINGDFTVTGTETIQNTIDLQVSDNLITVNSGESGPGVTSGYGGIIVDRGTANDYAFLFMEDTDTFRIGEFVVQTGNITSATSTTISFNGSSSTVDDFYNGRLMRITKVGETTQIRTITDYVGSTRTATVDTPWTTIPDILGIIEYL